MLMIWFREKSPDLVHESTSPDLDFILYFLRWCDEGAPENKIGKKSSVIGSTNHERHVVRIILSAARQPRQPDSPRQADC